MAEFKVIQEAVHKLSVEKGFHGDDTPIERLMRVIAKVASSAEAIRKTEPAIWQSGDKTPVVGNLHAIIKVFPSSASWKDATKPEGVLIELADAMIVLLDLAQSQGWDLEDAIRIKHKHNTTRTLSHGSKNL